MVNGTIKEYSKKWRFFFTVITQICMKNPLKGLSVILFGIQSAVSLGINQCLNFLYIKIVI